MMDTLTELKSQLRSAMRRLVVLEEYGSAQAFDDCRSLCASLRREINRMCPDGSLDVHEGNIVERV